MAATISSYTTTLDEPLLHAAMQGVVTGMAADVAVAFDADNQLAAIARTPVSLAAAYADLCEHLGVPVPRFVRLALD